MPKKSKKRGRGAAGGATSPGVNKPRRRRYYAAALSALALLAVTAAATRLDPVRRAVGLRPLALTPAQGNAPLPLSKEYIYAGGRLVATEEPTPAPTPTPTPAGPPPTILVATAQSASSVRLSWTPPASGTVIDYVVERTGGPDSATTELHTGSASASFTDSTTTGDYAYLYRVKAIFANGASDYSNRDIATTVPFTDDELHGAVIRAVHLTELRRAVKAVRRLVPGLGDPSWTYPDPVSSPLSSRRKIYLADVTDLRTELDEALGPLGLKTPYPAVPTLAKNAVVNAEHFEQIRERVR
jgi:hypothetical protein